MVLKVRVYLISMHMFGFNVLEVAKWVGWRMLVNGSNEVQVITGIFFWYGLG